MAEHGSGNTYIRRQIQKRVIKKEYDFAIIQWSTIDRWDYPFPIKTQNDTPLIKMNSNQFEINNKISYMRMGTNLNEKSLPFFQNYYSIYGQLLQTLEDIYFTQLTLEKLNIPYLMFTIANFMTTEVSFNTIKNISSTNADLMNQRVSMLDIEKVYEVFESADSLNEIKNKINWEKFIWTSDFKIDVFGDGFTEFLINKNQKFGDHGGTHPDSEQNKLLFDELILPRILKEIRYDS